MVLLSRSVYISSDDACLTTSGGGHEDLITFRSHSDHNASTPVLNASTPVLKCGLNQNVDQNKGCMLLPDVNGAKEAKRPCPPSITHRASYASSCVLVFITAGCHRFTAYRCLSVPCQEAYSSLTLLVQVPLLRRNHIGITRSPPGSL